MNELTLHKLEKVLLERKQADAGTSYVASLYQQGLPAILKKIGEESTETILAAVSDDQQALVHETADLWFHTMVMLAKQGVAVDDVLNELANRMGISGLDEKASRTPKN